MDFLRISQKKNIVSELLYILLNIALVIVLFFLISVSENVWLAFVLVLLSKWRVLAVRMRYWRANILANLVDITVGFSAVGLLYLANSADESVALWVQIGIAVLYIVWLTVIKPLSSKRAMLLQALIGIIVGTWTIMALSYVIPLSAVVILMFITAYGAARHALTVHEEEQLSFLSLTFAFLAAELSWVMYHWNVGYGLPLFGDMKIPQAAIFMAVGALVAERVYAAVSAKKPITNLEYLAPVLFSCATIAVLLLLFSSVGAGIV